MSFRRASRADRARRLRSRSRVYGGIAQASSRTHAERDVLVVGGGGGVGLRGEQDAATAPLATSKEAVSPSVSAPLVASST